ncbi:MAG: PEP-CTERM sorting domain-containing protein [Planctomycetes bacterium]|nr:PEP-CTERM sorting domain-containing protein [Planctomycetota bacterium]
MKFRSRQCRKLMAAGLLGLAPLLMMPASASAIFPPINRDPVVATPQVVTPLVVVDPPVVIVGEPDPPIVFVPDEKTPEPATIVSGLIALTCAGIFVRRRKLAHV